MTKSIIQVLCSFPFYLNLSIYLCFVSFLALVPSVKVFRHERKRRERKKKENRDRDRVRCYAVKCGTNPRDGIIKKGGDTAVIASSTAIPNMS